jgi:hypothetical protein
MKGKQTGEGIVPLTVGLSGQRLRIGLRDRTPSPENGLKEYRVILTLSRPGFPLQPEYEFDFGGQLKDDSHLAITKPVIDDPLAPDANVIVFGIPIPDVGNLEFKGYPNDEGYLGKIVLEGFSTASIQEAEDIAHYAVARWLSYLSTYLDIPLNIYGMRSDEVSTGNNQATLSLPFEGAPLLLAPQPGMSNEWLTYAGLYREALITNSSAYQFLCLFRIIDGLKERHQRLAIEAKSRGQAFSRPAFVIPATEADQIAWLNEIFPARRDWNSFVRGAIFQQEAIGKRARRVIDQQLRPLRNAIAHTLFESTGELFGSIDNEFHLSEVSKWAPFTKCLVRHMLKNEFPRAFSFVPARQIEIKKPS